MDLTPVLHHDSDVPLYRQLFEQIAVKIRTGGIEWGERLPPTRELAGLLGLNRTTVSAAYELLESEGLIAGQVGRGSFVTGVAKRTPGSTGGRCSIDWNRRSPTPGLAGGEGISFVMSRPSRDLFPLDDFRASCKSVLQHGDLAGILQLGSPSGYEPLRRRLLEDARAQGLAGPGDDLLVTNGCQQAIDLIARVLLRAGDAVVLEDPVYPGIRNLLSSMGARLVGIPTGAEGMDVTQLERAIERERPRFVIVTPNFQNPTGATMPAASRRLLIEITRNAGIPIIENDAYGELRYVGEDLPPIKQLDTRGGTALLRSFSKVSFPRLARRLGDRTKAAARPYPPGKGIVGPAHGSAFAQAVLLEFVESGRLAEHREARSERRRRRRLQATLGRMPRFAAARGRWWTQPGGRHEPVGSPAAAGATPRNCCLGRERQESAICRGGRSPYRGRNPRRCG